MEKQRNILLIEDDNEIAELVQIHMRDQGWNLDRAADGNDGLNLAQAGEYDLIILDIMLPGKDGLEICKEIRNSQDYVPVLMLTSRSEEVDRILGLELGADDYLTKPFSIRELIARSKAIFRRVQAVATKDITAENATVLEFGDLIINLQKRKVLLDSAVIDLTVKEYELLSLFARNPGRAYSRDDLLSLVWGYQFSGYEHTVNSHINRLRSKIEKDPSDPHFIKTVWGHGYRFAEKEEIG
ncbi:MAG: response regulator transcription factor [Candidatus Zixiibacteriota bacterium]